MKTIPLLLFVLLFSTTALADNCDYIRDADLRAVCQRKCEFVMDRDLRDFCKGRRDATVRFSGKRNERWEQDSNERENEEWGGDEDTDS